MIDIELIINDLHDSFFNLLWMEFGKITDFANVETKDRRTGEAPLPGSFLRTLPARTVSLACLRARPAVQPGDARNDKDNRRTDAAGRHGYSPERLCAPRSYVRCFLR